MGRGRPSLSLLFFTDDLVLFAEVDQSTAEVMHSILDEFCLQSGHKVSSSKSKLCFSTNTDERMKRLIGSLLGFQQMEDLGLYLRVPLFHTRTTSYTF